MYNVTIGMAASAVTHASRPSPYHVFQNDASTWCGRPTEGMVGVQRVPSTKPVKVCGNCTSSYASAHSGRESDL